MGKNSSADWVICELYDFVFYSFRYFEPVKFLENRSDVVMFWGFSPCWCPPPFPSSSIGPILVFLHSHFFAYHWISFVYFSRWRYPHPPQLSSSAWTWNWHRARIEVINQSK